VLSASLPEFVEYLLPGNSLSLVKLLQAGFYLPAQFVEPAYLELILLFEEPETLADDLARRTLVRKPWTGAFASLTGAYSGGSIKGEGSRC
jgi:hypothetical protein